MATFGRLLIDALLGIGQRNISIISFLGSVEDVRLVHWLWDIDQTKRLLWWRVFEGWFLEELWIFWRCFLGRDV